VNYENYRVLFIIVGPERIGMGGGEPFKKPCEIPAEIRLKALKSESREKMEIWRLSPTPQGIIFLMHWLPALTTG
jgi:hypothetical protein